MTRLILLTLAYFVAGWLGLKIPYAGSHITLVWLPTGIAVAALFRWGWSVWPGVYLGALLVNLSIGSTWPLAAAIAVGNTLGPLLTTEWLKRIKFHSAFDRQIDVGLFIIVASMGMAIPAVLGVLSLCLAGLMPLETISSAWVSWWMGDTVGVLLAAPLLLTLNRKNIQQLISASTEFLVWLLVAAIVGWVALIHNYEQIGNSLPIAFLTMPLLTWAGLRFGNTGATVASLGFSVLAAWGSATGRGAFLLYDIHINLLLLWIYMATTVLTGLLITALQAERRHIEQSLGETLASLQAVYDNLPFLAWMKDKEGRYLQANKHWLRAVGITDLNNLNGITDFDIWPKELAEHYQSVDQEVMHTRKQISLTERALDRGLETWTETIKAPVIDDKGQVIGTTGLAKNISESRCADQQMRNYSERLHLASKAAAIGVCEWDISNGLADWDNRMYEIFGIPLGDIINYSAWASTVFPEDLPNAKAKIRKLIREKQEIHWEFRICRQNDGALRYIQASAIASHDDKGKIIKIVGVNIDITDFKQIEIALREKKAHLAQAQAQAHLGSWSLDIVNNILQWSDECYRIFEIPLGTPLTYEYFLALIHPDDRFCVDEAWQDAIQGQPYDIQHRIIVNEKIKWLRERAELEFAADGRLLRGVGTSQDITELKETEHNLESSRLQLRQLAARREKAREEERKHIAREIHDELGQMLTALRMEISLLRIKFAVDNKEFLGNIQSIMGLLDKTIQVTRDVATSLRPSAIEMGIGSALEWLVRKFSEQSGIGCELFYPEDNFDMDEGCSIVIFRIAQESLTNVLRHAEASNVRISVKLDSDHYYLEIQDNGKGFDSAAFRNTNSFGLIGIQERSIMLGGETTISSSPGNGTFIKVRIPANTLKQTL